MTDVRKLQNLKHLMEVAMKFVPQEDDKGDRLYYHDWVLAETDED